MIATVTAMGGHSVAKGLQMQHLQYGWVPVTGISSIAGDAAIAELALAPFLDSIVISPAGHAPHRMPLGMQKGIR